jgi:hypothetical protein
MRYIYTHIYIYIFIYLSKNTKDIFSILKPPGGGGPEATKMAPWIGVGSKGALVDVIPKIFGLIAGEYEGFMGINRT